MNNELCVALLQMLPGNNINENMLIGIDYCQRAKEKGADIALFPEMFSCGYDIPEDISVLNSTAIDEDDEYLRTFRLLAKELNMAIGVTFLEKHEGLPKNSIIIYDRNGEKVLHFSKVHTCDFGDECRLTPGDDFYVSDLDTRVGEIKIGAMICYDREFPESARILMLKGAEIILVPNACPMEINRISQLRARAFENMLGIATCNYPEGQPDCNGHSTAFDGITCADGYSYPRETCIIEAGGEPGIYLANFDMDLLRSYRLREVHGNSYRHPSKYSILIDDQVEAPFIRKDSRR